VSGGGASAAAYLLGQSMVSSVQVTAHLVNEYADAAADAAVRNRTWFSGGSGVIAGGAVERSTALRAASISSLVAVGTVVAVAGRDPLAAAIGAGAFAVAWAYSIEPVRLLATGVGEVLTTVVVAAGVPLTGAAMANGAASDGVCWAIAVLVPVHLAMMLTFELPDLETDTVAGKRVLAVRLGAPTTRRAIAALMGLALVMIALSVAVGRLPVRAGWAATATLPALLTIRAITRERWMHATAGAVATLVVAALGLMAGL